MMSPFQHTTTRRWLPKSAVCFSFDSSFQHTATRRWLLFSSRGEDFTNRVSTHSHPKVAAQNLAQKRHDLWVSTHSRAEAAASRKLHLNKPKMFQHTAARRRLPKNGGIFNMELEFQHTAARRRLLVAPLALIHFLMFQHTAARRRLPFLLLK